MDVNGVNYKIFISSKTHLDLPGLGDELKVFTHLHVREDLMELFGFIHERDLGLFEKLISVSGIGPRSALGVMAVAPFEQLVATISEGKPELLTKAAGVGKKTAERVVLELRDKLAVLNSEEVVRGMESDLDLEDALTGLGYSKVDAKRAISKIDTKKEKFEDRLKEALRAVKN